MSRPRAALQPGGLEARLQGDLDTNKIAGSLAAKIRYASAHIPSGFRSNAFRYAGRRATFLEVFR